MAVEFSTMSTRGKWTVIGGLCVVLIGVFYLYVWQPYQEDVATLQTQIADVRMEIQRTQAIADQLPDLENHLADLEERLEILSIILPEERQADALLRGLQSVASDVGLNIQRITNREFVAFDFYAEAPFELALAGSYHDLARFFDRISKMARVVNIDEVEIQQVSDVPGATVQANCTAKTFFFIEPPEEPSEEEGEQAGEATQQGDSAP